MSANSIRFVFLKGREIKAWQMKVTYLDSKLLILHKLKTSQNIEDHMDLYINHPNGLEEFKESIVLVHLSNPEVVVAKNLKDAEDLVKKMMTKKRKREKEIEESPELKKSRNNQTVVIENLI